MRSSLMVIEKALGKSIPDISRKYNLPAGRVRRELTFAAENGFIEHFRALLYETLAPKVLAVYEAHLELGSLEAARDLAYGMGILSRDAPHSARLKDKLVDSLDSYRKARRERDLPPPLDREGVTIDVQVPD